VELVKKTYSVFDNFESGNTSKWDTFTDGSSTITPTISSPGKIGSYAMTVQYNVVSYGGVAQWFSTPQDWSSYNAFEFWFYGTASGTSIRLEVSDNRSDLTTDTAERFEYLFTDNFTGWKFFSLPWGSFSRRVSFQPVGAPNDGFTLTQIWGFCFAPRGGSSSFRLDQVQLMR
jgi:hypothetical protein